MNFTGTFFGRLGSDPELKFLKDGTAVCNFSLAIDQGEDDTLWIRVAVWGDSAEACNTYLQKGSKALVVPRRLKIDAYVNDAGEPVGVLEVTAARVVFADSAPSGNGGGKRGSGGQQRRGGGKPQQRRGKQQRPRPQPEPDYEDEYDDGEPF